MKKFILILISLLFVTGISEGKEVSYLQNRNGIKYEVNSETPFTGRLVKKYENGQKKEETNYKDGKKDGVFTFWFENGQKKLEGKFKNGKDVGLWTGWHKNGQKGLEWNLKNGKEDGLLTIWDEEGNVTETKTSKDGELVSP